MGSEYLEGGEEEGGKMHVCNAIADYFPRRIRDSIKILDVTARPGVVGEKLKQLGFQVIDGLQPPTQGKHGGISSYRKIHHVHLQSEEIKEIPINSYDCLSIAGGMKEVGIPVKAFHEIIRIVRQGGLIFIMEKEEDLTCAWEYHNMDKYIKQLEHENYWLLVSRTRIEEFALEKPRILFVLRVTANFVRDQPIIPTRY